MAKFYCNFHRMFAAVFIYITMSSAASIPIPGLRSNRISNALNPNGDNFNFNINDWVKISEAPPQIVTHPMGARVELECEAVGFPSPTIQWIKGNRALTENESYESNMINDQLSQGLSKIKSRLVINNLLPMHQGPFTCVATAGSKSSMAVTNLLVTQAKTGSQHNLSDYLNTNLIQMTQPSVRIVLFNTVVMQPMGSDVVLPCKVIGTPKPEIFWIDANNEQIFENQDPRFKILPDGELRITDLSWADMGAYSCVARNEFAKDTTTTFVYPLLNEN